MSDFSKLIPNARTFLTDLAANNTRDWWQENKTTYDTAMKGPAQALLETLTPELSQIADAPIKTKLFRPHRDVRFSKDKTPYNTHLHMMWQIDAGAPQNPVFFFGIGLDYITAGAGIMGFDKPVLMNWRQMVDLDTDRIQGIVKELTAKGYALREPDLKRVPPPYDKDHPAADLLRMKSVTGSRELDASAKLPEDLLGSFRDLWPLNALLISIAEA